MYAKGTIGPPTNFSNKFGRVRGAICMPKGPYAPLPIAPIGLGG